MSSAASVKRRSASSVTAVRTYHQGEDGEHQPDHHDGEGGRAGPSSPQTFVRHSSPATRVEVDRTRGRRRS